MKTITDTQCITHDNQCIIGIDSSTSEQLGELK